MKAVHVQGTGAKAEALAQHLRRTGTDCTCGLEAPPQAKYLVMLRGDDTPTLRDVLQAIQAARDNGQFHECQRFSVRVVPSRERSAALAGAPSGLAGAQAEPEAERMVSPEVQRIIQIDVTDACPRTCSNCTRLCGHRGTAYFMSESQFREAVDSLQGYGGMVGMMGGEPTLHPRFAGMSMYLAQRRPDPAPGPEEFAPCEDWEGAHQNVLRWRPWKKGLWTGLGPGYRRHYELIQRLYRYQCVNDHRGGCRHTALMVSRRDLGIPDAEWTTYRDACWLQRLWSATVTPRGAYFCEVAAALALTLGGPDGWPVEPEWWKRTPAEFGDQLEMCEYCSACLPVPARVDADGVDQVSPGMAERLRSAGSRKPVEVVTASWAELKARHKAGTTVEPYLEAGDGRRVHCPSGLEVGRVTGVVVCRGYDDYLKLTLPRMVKELDRVIVVTVPQDYATLDMASRFGAEVLLSEAISGNQFAKGRAISEALGKLDDGEWVLLLDADIVLPSGWGQRARGMILNPGTLYYAERRGPPLDYWQSAVSLAKLATSCDNWEAVWETVGSRAFSQKAPYGYFQLFNLRAEAVRNRETRYPAAYQTAEGDDATFSAEWYGPKKCFLLPGALGLVVHLPHGPSRVNWNGRRSPRLDDDWWWVDDPTLLWRTSYRSGASFRGLWSLTQKVRENLPAGAIVEIGTMLGDGAAVLAAGFPDRRIITVDPGPNPKVQAEAARRCGLWHNVERWVMTSAEAAERVAAEGLQVAMVYLDGDHTEGGVRADIRAWRGLVAQGGVLSGHDYGEPAWPGVKAAVDEEVLAQGMADRFTFFVDQSWMVTKEDPRG